MRLFERFGVDYEQWKALTAAAITLDARGMQGGNPSRYGLMTAHLGLQVVVYSGFGLFIAILVWMVRDLWLVATIAMTYTMLTVGMMVFIDHNSIVSPADYVILAHHPVNSRTYFASRLANALIYTTAVTAVLAWLPLISLFVRYGPLVSIAAAVAFFCASTTIALSILIGYAIVMRTFGAHRVRRALSYSQLAMSFLTYGGFVFGTERMSMLAAGGGAFARSRWLLLFPPTWFASYLEIARGSATRVQVALALASIALIGAMARALGGRLTLEYSQHLAETIARSERAGSSAMSAWNPLRLFASGEARAVALLVRSQFQNDLKFRLGVLSIVPLTLFYAWYGGSAAVRDPFVARPPEPSYPLLLIAVLMFPATLRAQLAGSDAFRASWIFFATPSDRMRIIRSTKNVIVAMFLIPYLVFVGALFVLMTRSVAHVAVHLTLIGLLSHLGLQILVLIDPALPFSRPIAKGSSPAWFFAFTMGSSLAAVALQIASPFLYGSRFATIVAFALVVAASVAVSRATNARVALQTSGIEFRG